MKEVMLSTIDNPYNPFTQFDEWNAYDVSKGYNTNCYLARVAVTSPELSDVDYAQAIDDAIDEIVEINCLGLYTKVYNENPP